MTHSVWSTTEFYKAFDHAEYMQQIPANVNERLQHQLVAFSNLHSPRNHFQPKPTTSSKDLRDVACQQSNENLGRNLEISGLRKSLSKETNVALKHGQKKNLSSESSRVKLGSNIELNVFSNQKIRRSSGNASLKSGKSFKGSGGSNISDNELKVETSYHKRSGESQRQDSDYLSIYALSSSNVNQSLEENEIYAAEGEYSNERISEKRQLLHSSLQNDSKTKRRMEKDF